MLSKVTHYNHNVIVYIKNQYRKNEKTIT